MAARPFRSEGYRDLAVSTAASKGLFEWMGRQEAIGNEEGHDAPGYTSVKNAMTSALPDSQEVWFSAKLGEPAIKWRSNLVIPYSKLSDGQKAVITIAGDISRRAALLNPHLDDPVSETPGVVLIDEIDLHLHPRWQRRIMEDLRRVFPKIQFIATTHSPIIISAAKDAKVINLDANGSHEISQAYGMDVNWVVDIIQGAESQAPEIAALIREADDFIEDGKLDESRAIAEKLEILQNGPSPDSVGIGARIDNLIALAHAED